MASIAIHPVAKFPSFNPTNKPAPISCTNALPPKKAPQQFPSVSIPALSHRNVISTHHRPSVDFTGRIDSWLHDSVEDIVKNLKHAPLLVQIYSEFDGEVEIRTEKAEIDEWAVVRDEWRSGESKSPDGLIFVEELGGGDEEEGEGVRKAWGIVVQGKGAKCGPACYLLKTDRVCAGVGLGFCTHFCLMKVNNFRDSALEQFQNSWLLQ